MKNKFLKSTLILLIGGCFTKVLGLLIKILYTRIIKENGIALHSLVMPTYSLLITLASFNIQLAVSKRISSNSGSKKVVFNACFIMFVLNLVLIVGGLLLAKLVSVNLLKNIDTYYPIIACLITLPFISIGYIIKGYFYGKQNVLPHMISNVLEQSFRFLIIMFFLPKIIKYGTVVSVTCLILFNVLSESFSIFIFMFFLPKKFNLHKNDLLVNKHESMELLRISVPSVSGRLLCNIGYFFEPIILTNILLYKGLSSDFIMYEYGIYNAYAIGTLLFPSFFVGAISNALLPEISKFNATKNTKMIKKRIKESLILSLIVGMICTAIIFIFKEKILSLLYDTSEGIKYITYLAPFFILFYLESPLSTILIALDKVKNCTFISVSGMIIKLIVMTVLCFVNFKMMALLIAEVVNIVYVTLANFISLKKEIY